jgi:hypothetical protein
MSNTLHKVTVIWNFQNGLQVAGVDVGTGGSGGVTKYAADFSGTTVTILGTTHGLGTKDLTVLAYDAQTPAHLISPGSVTVHPTTFDVVLTFAETQAGRVVLL